MTATAPDAAAADAAADDASAAYAAADDASAADAASLFNASFLAAERGAVLKPCLSRS